MAWPDDRDLPIEVHAAFGADVTADPGTWSWTDLTSRLRAEPIRLRAGKSGGAGQVSPGTCTVTLDNDDAALTPLHPMSPYWPNVELGTPLRVSLRRMEDAFARTLASGWGSTDTDDVWEGYGSGGTTLATDFPVGSGKARHSVPVVSAYRTTWLPGLSLLDCRVHLSGVSLPFSDVTGGPVEPGNILLRAQSFTEYYLARVEITTAEAVVCKLYDPSGVELASATVSGLTHTSAQTLEVVADITGSTLSMKVWATAAAEPSGWTVTATDDSLNLPGGIGVRTGVGAGNTNTKPIVASYESVAVFVDRFSGGADQWEPTYLPTGVVGQMASAVRITASGILRRVQQGTQLVQSPLRRTIGGSAPVAYWPGEDGVLASQAGSAMSGASPLAVTGAVEFTAVADYVTFAGSTTRYGTTALANLADGGSLAAQVPAAATAATAGGPWTVHALVLADPTTLSGDMVVCEWTTTSGTYVRWQMKVTTTSRTQVIAYTSGGVPTTLIDDGSATPSFAHFAVSASVSGGTVTVLLHRRETTTPSTTFAGSLGGVTSVTVNPDGVTSTIDMPAGHVAVWATSTLPLDRTAFFDAYGGIVREARRSWEGEASVDRLVRLAAEDGIALDTAVPPADAVQRMGWQAPGAALDLYGECESVDGGILHERGFGLAYLPRVARYNRAADLTIDLATYAVTGNGEPLAPVYDDQNLRNRWTVERTEGSFAVADDIVSQRRGVYRDSVELNLAGDDQLADQAGWRLHLDSEQDLREATFPIDLAANPGLLDGWLSCQVGSRIVRTNPPAQHRPGPLDRTVAGWTETIGPRSWLVQVVPAPAAPWDVATVDGEPRVAADGSTLAADLTAGVTSLLLASTAENGTWTTDPTDFPLDVRVGGERVTASAIASPLVDTFTRTVSGGWGTADTGQVWTVDGSAAQYSVATDLAVHRVNALNTAFRSRTTGLTLGDVDWLVGVRLDLAPTGLYIRTEPAVRIVNVNNYYALRVHVQTSGDVDLQLIRVSGGVEASLAAVPSGVTNVAGTVLWLRLRADGSTLRGRVWRNGTAEPGWQITATDSTHTAGDVGVTTLFPPGNTNALPYNVIYDNVTVGNPQLVTLSARAVNGVTRAWPAGTPVDVWTPAIAPL